MKAADTLCPLAFCVDWAVWLLRRGFGDGWRGVSIPGHFGGSPGGEGQGRQTVGSDYPEDRALLFCGRGDVAQGLLQRGPDPPLFAGCLQARLRVRLPLELPSLLARRSGPCQTILLPVLALKLSICSFLHTKVILFISIKR